MNKLNFTFLNIATLVLISNPSYADRTYVCKPCPMGTYSDGTKTSCTACPLGYVCPLGAAAPIPIANCTKSLIKSFTSGSTDTILFEGIYMVEVAGAGGGGGGSYGGTSGFTCYYRSGADGGKGDKRESSVFYVQSSKVFRSNVGNAGKGGDSRGNGGNGWASQFYSLADNTIYLQAAGGYGGGAGTKSSNGSVGRDAGNGLGGCGGAGRGKTKCKSNPGYAGCNGWVKIYQLGNCHN